VASAAAEGHRPSGDPPRIGERALCGIAGYSLSDESRVDQTLATQTLLAAIAERGSDAVGYAYRGPGLSVAVHKQRGGASALLERLAVPEDARQALVHVRDYTKGHPSLTANNHPIRHGPVVGVHNGIILNDEEILAGHGFERAERGMTVDSEAIFALADDAANRASALEELHGSMAAAWFDERDAETLYLARGIGRPLWVGEGGAELFFASTSEALELVERYAEVRLRKREVGEGTFLAIADGGVRRTDSFEPDRSFVEDSALPPVRAPEEARSCLARLATIATATARAR
jgi:glucosamine 6-phosphate synthetase-like amidotransferase/phosphosugar isomerase protein